MICKRVIPYNDIVGESAPFAHPCCPYVIVYDRQVGNRIEISSFVAVFHIERVVRTCSVHCEGDGNMLVRSGLAGRLSSHVCEDEIHYSVVGLAYLFLESVRPADHRARSRALFLDDFHAFRAVAVVPVVALGNIDISELFSYLMTAGKTGGDVVLDAVADVCSQILIGVAYLMPCDIFHAAPPRTLESVAGMCDVYAV